MTAADNKRADGTRVNASEARLEETFVLLDNSAGTGAPTLLFSNPKEIVSAMTPDEVGPALARLEAAAAEGLHAAGFFAYELGYVLESKIRDLLPEGRNVPLLWFGLYDAPRAMSEAEVDHWLGTHTKSGSYQFTSVTTAWSQEEYEARFAAVQEKIRAGDIYQLNLTFKARFRLEGSPLTFYRDMRRRQRVAYAGIVDTGEVTVLSASPELFIEKDDRVVSTRPMKGTAPRAGTPEADAEARRVLSTDVKQRAENLMIVDLMRNDLGRIAEVGSVGVTDLFTVETFRTLHQMTSGVEATLKEGLGLGDLVRAIFPPGSVIGAPKIRAMELIRDYETEPRGVYCGAIGHITPGGAALFNVAIRTPVIFRGGQGEMGIGSGVVYDSVGAKEYAECLLKMKFLTDPPKSFELIETLLYESGKGFWLLEGHLERLKASAAYFGYAHDERAVREALDRAVDGRPEARLRVRLLLAEDGAVSVTVAEQPAQAAGTAMRYAISDTRVDSANPFLFHKTTRRELYDREWQHYADTKGADEVLYLNERGELAEGSRTNIFIERDGKLLTPPLSSGLLPGVLRRDLILQGKAAEAVLTLDDLERADAVYVGNSVRGLVRAEPVTAAAG
ncbi:aminodeoxychorismate synthase component I [Hyphomicrobium sp.]|uniref:aminodeoxychorismate synthase component I n=1 Tax=Hyphomicrobium sp. TaxID=82 RepID=UPI002B841C05|nr:aminodeoxychorismate synthase component I [Hyphomicrobium sp.]HRN88894.1 aminodeoxychorismate synthase component I [Hyphomicrobium sp.]HRQ28238.1 aminodeoxychorismate synthase component I [Hyphomicrobium sp.]